jgi:hypothetical protein
MPESPILYLALLGLVIGSAAWAGWTLGARRRANQPKPLPAQLWLCEACHSFNELERMICYACRRVRPVDAQTVTPDVEFRVDQHMARPIDHGGRGASRPWLGADEPLLDSWLTAHPGVVRPGPSADDEATPIGSTADETSPTQG